MYEKRLGTAAGGRLMADMKKMPQKRKGKQAGKMQGMLDMQHGEMHGMDMHGMMGIMPPIAGVDKMQMASGTSWHPLSTPMFAIHKMSGRWALMMHYNAFLSYDLQEGLRGNYQYNSTN